MCWQCKELDKVIDRYRTLGERTTDKQTLDGIELLIQKAEAEKKLLHRDQSEGSDAE
jgi:hypothetical protein